MYREASLSLRILYCVAVLSAVVPYGMSGWVAATLGQYRPSGIFQVVPLAVTALGLWRIYFVVRYHETLGAYVFDGAIGFTRFLGVIGMVVAALYLIVQLGYRPLMLSMEGGADASVQGIGGYVVGVYLAMFGSVASLGLWIFEASRMLGFERNASASAAEVATT